MATSTEQAPRIYVNALGVASGPYDDLFVAQAKRALYAACPKITDIVDRLEGDILILTVTGKQLMLEDIEQISARQWELMDRFDRTLHVEIRDSANL